MDACNPGPSTERLGSNRDERTSGGIDAAGIRLAATGIDGRAMYHLVRKCDDCKSYRRHPKRCFNKGHKQLIQTVRSSENGTALEDVATGEVLSRHNEGDKYYHVLKPASRVFAWDDRDQMSEVPWANLSSLKCLAMAEGTILLRSVPAKPVMFWLSNTCTQLPVEDYPIPARVASARPNRSPGWEWVPDEDSLAEAGEDGAAEGRDQASRKRKESPSPAVAAAGSGGAEQRQRQEEEGASQQAAKRRASRRPGAGVRVSPVGSGGPLGEAGGPGAEGRTAQKTDSIPGPATKDEVHQVLAERLRACDKRELELRAVIEKATTELKNNSERRKAAVAESEQQLLSIIAQREAQAAYYEQLAAQARAQNTFDRESLQAHKEKTQKKVGGMDLVVTVVGAVPEADAAAEAAAAAAVKVSRKPAVGTRDAQAASEETARPGKAVVQVQKDRGTGRVTASGAGVTESSSWSIGAQAARLAQAQSAQAQLAQASSAQPQSVRAPDRAGTAVQAPPSTTSAEEGAAAATATDASPPQPLLGEHETQLEVEKARVREKFLVEKELLQLENKETGAGSSPAAAGMAQAQPLLPAGAAPVVVKPTASLLVGDMTVADVSGGMAKACGAQAPDATTTAALGSAAVSVNDASPAVAAPAVTPSDNSPSNYSAMVADVSRAAIPAAAPASCMRVGQQLVSPGGDGGGSGPGLVEQRVQPQEAEGDLTATAEVGAAGGALRQALRQAQNPATLAVASSATPVIMGQGWESHPPSSTGGGEVTGSQVVVGAAKATAAPETPAIGTAAATPATAKMARNNGNTSQSKKDSTMKTFHLALADLFAAGGR